MSACFTPFPPAGAALMCTKLLQDLGWTFDDQNWLWDLHDASWSLWWSYSNRFLSPPSSSHKWYWRPLISTWQAQTTTEILYNYLSIYNTFAPNIIFLEPSCLPVWFYSYLHPRSLAPTHSLRHHHPSKVLSMGNRSCNLSKRSFHSCRCISCTGSNKK